ncbi:MAG TPA: nuclear transport factor 2 family protein [Actinomycetota bacterium]|nr:nuclear transport factor 2 family protein [Actinomycetota bacterium]
MAHPNEELARRGYAAFSSGDMDALNELLADDIKWHVGGRSQLTGEYEGKEAVFGLFARLVELTGGSFKVDLHDVLANDEHTVGLIHATADREGKHLDDNGVQVFHVRDGKITEAWLHPGDAYASDEFFA